MLGAIEPDGGDPVARAGGVEDGFVRNLLAREPLARGQEAKRLDPRSLVPDEPAPTEGENFRDVCDVADPVGRNGTCGLWDWKSLMSHGWSRLRHIADEMWK